MLVYADNGTPGFIVDTAVDAYAALGELHGKHRPLQTLLLATAARGRLAEHLIPREDLAGIDRIVHRWDLPRIAAADEKHLDEQTRRRLDAYLAGVKKGVRLPWLPLPDRVSVLSGLMLSSYLGLAQGQERMELAIMQAVQEGADVALLEAMFAPHLHGWQPQRLGSVALPKVFRVAGGSNAWAVTGERSASGFPMLAGDPHLQIDQWPALFFEIAARVGDNYWLGATIPGLPGLALGRTRDIAWSGTFSVADNVDFTFDDAPGVTREVELRRRFKRPIVLRFVDTPSGVREGGLACQWHARREPAKALGAYLRLPDARSAEEAERVLVDARTLSLHYVITDKHDARFCQAGSVARDAALYPKEAPRDTQLIELPRAPAEDGIVCSANEQRGYSPLHQPPYRFDRIRQLLSARRDHDVASFAAIQLDIFSRQAELLSPRLGLPMWDNLYNGSEAAALFDATYKQACRELGERLGGRWFAHLYDTTELGVWWAHALDPHLQPAHAYPEEIRTVTFRHLLFGIGKGPYFLPGSLATVRQGNHVAGQTIGPAYRFITDMGKDEAFATLPGGIDGHPLSKSYTCWLDEWRRGGYHRLQPP